MTSYGPLLDALRGARWPARRAVAAALPGAHRSRQRGTSGEFTEYRVYRQGDDPKRIDWKLLGRSDRAFVRLTDDRAIVGTWLVVDGSASMDFPVDASGGRHSKWQVACAVAVGLTAVANASHDPVGLAVTSADGVTRLAARARRGTIGDVARALDALACGGNAPLTPLVDVMPTSARVVVISDFLGDVDAMQRAVAQRTAAGATVECVHVVAADELDPPAGVYLARDPESRTEERLLNRRTLAAYQSRFAAFRAETARQFRAAGAGYTEIRTDAPLSRLVRQIVVGQGRDRARDARPANGPT